MTDAPCSRLHPCEDAQALWDRVADAHHEYAFEVRQRGMWSTSAGPARRFFDTAYAAYLAHFQTHTAAKEQALL